VAPRVQSLVGRPYYMQLMAWPQGPSTAWKHESSSPSSVCREPEAQVESERLQGLHRASQPQGGAGSYPGTAIRPSASAGHHERTSRFVTYITKDVQLKTSRDDA
jgi:hypothetical protein